MINNTYNNYRHGYKSPDASNNYKVDYDINNNMSNINYQNNVPNYHMDNPGYSHNNQIKANNPLNFKFDSNDKHLNNKYQLKSMQNNDIDSISINSMSKTANQPNKYYMPNQNNGEYNVPNGNLYNRDNYNNLNTSSKDSGIYHLTTQKRNTKDNNSIYSQNNSKDGNVLNSGNLWQKNIAASKNNILGSQNSLINDNRSNYENPIKQDMGSNQQIKSPSLQNHNSMFNLSKK